MSRVIGTCNSCGENVLKGTDHRCQVARLRAAVKRLTKERDAARAALQVIADDDGRPISTGWEDAYRRVVRVARRFLAAESGTPDRPGSVECDYCRGAGKKGNGSPCPFCGGTGRTA